MNTTILLFLLQDGITNGAIYALLGLALVLVFAVTRVILIPQGEFVTYGALTYASLAAGRMPGALAAGGVAAYVTAFALAALGFASFQTWWLMTLTAVALLFTAIARGQYRTERPVAPLGRRPKAPSIPAGQ